MLSHIHLSVRKSQSSWMLGRLMCCLWEEGLNLSAGEVGGRTRKSDGGRLAGINECEEERNPTLPGLMCVPEAGRERAFRL